MKWRCNKCQKSVGQGGAEDMNVLLSASKMMTAGEANQLIKQSLRNKEELALADLQAKQTIEQ